ncbi:MAG: protein rep [Gammaproteobacteria bacterium]|nr:protein rep [Gammaproteobacteria bacterium]
MGLGGDTLSQVFRHSGWKRDRVTVYRALARTGQSASRLQGFSACGDNAYVLKSDEDPPRYRVAGSSCHDRFCQVCASERSQAIALNVIQAIGTDRVRFVTLTLRQQHRPLAETIDALYQAFRKLQRLKQWRQRVKAGVGFLELKYKEQSGLWNCHLHLLVTGKFIPKRDLSAWWHTITGDSMIVKIKLPGDAEGVTRYVTKYASKPLNNSYLQFPRALDEAIVAIKGRRMATTFGGWRGVLLVDHPNEDAWENLGPLDQWIARAADGDEHAVNLLRQINAARADTAIAVHNAARAPPEDPQPEPERQLLLLNPAWTPF